jgi:hypothetical protein
MLFIPCCELCTLHDERSVWRPFLSAYLGMIVTFRWELLLIEGGSFCLFSTAQVCQALGELH